MYIMDWVNIAEVSIVADPDQGSNNKTLMTARQNISKRQKGILKL